MLFDGLDAKVVPRAVHLREHIDVTAAGADWLQIRAAGVGDFSQRYAVSSADNVALGSLKRRGMASLGRLQFGWSGADRQEHGELVEVSRLAWLRPGIPWLPARFEVRWQGHVAATIRQRLTWRGWRWSVQILGVLPRELLLAQLALLAVVEARRDGA